MDVFFFVLWKNGKYYGALNKLGTEVVPVIYSSFKYLGNGSIEFKKNDKVVVYPK